MFLHAAAHVLSEVGSFPDLQVLVFVMAKQLTTQDSLQPRAGN